jgi:hypothetical protein
MPGKLLILVTAALALAAWAAGAEPSAPEAAAPPGHGPAGAAVFDGAPFSLPAARPPRVQPSQPRGRVTDDDVRRAIDKGREYLINLQNPDGSFGTEGGGRNPRAALGSMRGCYSTLIFMTLAYMGEHPNHDVMGKALEYVLKLDPDRDFAGRQGYALPIRAMGLCYVHRMLVDKKQALIKEAVKRDLARLVKSQQGDGGWRYALSPDETYDFSVTQWSILAMREATLIGLEMPDEPLRKALALYRRGQNPDGGWAYTVGSGKSYQSMTAAGLASLFILLDELEPSSGCPCAGSRSRAISSETDRRIDAALKWIADDYDRPGGGGSSWGYYGIYCTERVGIAAGYKYFGRHNW